MDPISKPFKKIKKLKKKNGAVPNTLVKNYAKLAAKPSIEILKELFILNTTGFNNTIAGSLNTSALLAPAQTLYIIIDELSARELETIVSKTNIADADAKVLRCTNIRQNKPQHSHFGIWYEIFNREYKKETKGPIRNIVGVKKRSEKETLNFYDKVHGYVLNENQLKENLYPCSDSHVDYLKTSDWPLLNYDIKVYAMDCEMVETISGFELARLTLVDENFITVYDQLVKPESEVINYHAAITGIDIQTYACNKAIVRQDVIEDLKEYIDSNTILVGHSLENDLHALKLIHTNIIDTSIIFPKHQGYKYSLKSLAYNYFKLKIQESTHDSAEDAKMALALLKVKAEILCHFPDEIAQGREYDLLKTYCETKNLLVLDFRFNIQSLLQYGVAYEKIDDTIDIFAHMRKHIMKNRNDNGYCSSIYSRIYMHKVHYETKETQLVEFINWAIEKKAELQSFNIVITTVSCTKFHKVDGFDIMYFI